MYIVDPLKLKIEQLLSDGQANPLNQARLRYGTENDLHVLLEEVKKLNPSAKNSFFVDFTPFERIGRPERFISELATINKPRPVLLSIKDTVFNNSVSLPLINMVFSEQGQLLSIVGGDERDERLLQSLTNYYGTNTSLLDLRKPVIEANLTDLLFNPGCLDIPSKADEESTYIYLAGRYYRKMPNGMFVSCYLNLKELGKDSRALLTIAYEIVIAIMDYFRRDQTLLESFDYVVTPNNTALFLASCVQAILDIPVLCIDRLGPIPALNIQSSKLHDQLHDRRVILIEEVVATGNELDRAVFYLNSLRATIIKVITLYNLEVGMPMLVTQDMVTSLCKPKDELKYVYRSA